MGLLFAAAACGSSMQQHHAAAACSMQHAAAVCSSTMQQHHAAASCSSRVLILLLHLYLLAFFKFFSKLNIYIFLQFSIFLFCITILGVILYTTGSDTYLSDSSRCLVFKSTTDHNMSATLLYCTIGRTSTATFGIPDSHLNITIYPILYH